MSKSKWIPTLSATAAALLLAVGAASAIAAEEPIFGWQLMTEQERIEQRQKMLSAKTPEERDAVRNEHHQKMLERARQQGVTLPETAPAQGMGQGRGLGRGQGMGPGRGRGQGQGMGGGPGMGNRLAPRQP
ncbi:MAG: hypothetical protein FWD50_03235 [Betaproteobacteria bacterium]|nr:hypothetical protein [Betaproteobacteria bacterium]